MTSNFTKHVLSWLRDNNIYVGIISSLDWKFNTVQDFVLINHILLLDKYYIFYRKNNLSFHLQKWEKLINELKSW